MFSWHRHFPMRPDLKRLLKEKVEKGAFERTTVRWERGHPVTMVTFDREDEEVVRRDVEARGTERTREAPHTRGFHYTATKLPTPRSTLSGLFFGSSEHDSGEADCVASRARPSRAGDGTESGSAGGKRSRAASNARPRARARRWGSRPCPGFGPRDERT